ncbi:MAG TPA: PEGA domain-containing protein [Vicinamibacterales bacterium]|nr:PEGA domain-containing protein [Vicinamibacterales bacterium]
MSHARDFALDGPRGGSSPQERLATWYSQGLSDGLGDRLLMFDNSSAPSLELLRFRPDLTARPGFEVALRERVRRLSYFRHDAFARVRAVEYLGDRDGLALISNFTPGKRLSEVLSEARGPWLAASLVRQLTPALAALHAQDRGIVHAALSADRIVVTPEGRLVIIEHVLGSALQRLELSADRFAELGILVPPSRGTSTTRLDSRTDFFQLALVALSLLLGRRVAAHEYPDSLGELLDQATSGPGGRTNVALRRWLERALLLNGPVFESGSDAEAASQGLLSEVDAHQEARLRALLAAPADVPSAAPIESLQLPAPPRELPPRLEPQRILDAWPVAAPRVEALPLIEVAPRTEPPPRPPIEIRQPAAEPVDLPRPTAAQSPPLTSASPQPIREALRSKREPIVAAETNTSPPAQPVEPSAEAADLLLQWVDPIPHVPVAPPPQLERIIAQPPNQARVAAPAPIDVTPTDVTPIDVTPADVLPIELPPVVTTPVATTPVITTPEIATPTVEVPVVGEPQRLATPVIATPTVEPRVVEVPVVEEPQPLAPPASADETPLAPTLEAPAAEPDAPVRRRPAPRERGQPRQPAAKKRSVASQWFTAIVTGCAIGEALVISLIVFGHLGTTPPATVDQGASGVVDERARGSAAAVEKPAPAGKAAGRAAGPAAKATDAGTVATIGRQPRDRVPSRSADRPAANSRSTGFTISSPLVLQVFEGDRLLGSTADGTISVAPGRREVDLVNTSVGYRARQTVYVRPGTIASIGVSLPSGRVSVNASPWAEVFIDGKSVGETPLGNLSVPIGEHEFVFRHPQLGERRQTATVRADGLTRVTADLQR